MNRRAPMDSDKSNNPYASPNGAPVSLPAGAAVAPSYRWIIYVHVLGVVTCGLFSYLDRHGGLDILPAPIVSVLFLPAVLTLFLCPLVVLGAMLSRRLRGRQAIAVCVAEITIESAQLVALLPAVS